MYFAARREDTGPENPGTGSGLEGKGDVDAYFHRCP